MHDYDMRRIEHIEGTLENLNKSLDLIRPYGDRELIAQYEALIRSYQRDLSSLLCAYDRPQPPGKLARQKDREHRRNFLLHALKHEPGTVAELRERIGPRPHLVVTYHYKFANYMRKCNGHADEVRQMYLSSHLFNDLNCWLRKGRVVKTYLDDGHVMWFLQR
jgi:hypothetical protein